jgi:pSer/pThr/pTyr-binding forkhead associated (FHA) protein
MTIHAQLPSAPSPQPPIHQTLSFEAPQTPVLNAFALLDHRTRATALPEAGAPPGRYLALDDDGPVQLLPLNRSIIHIGRGLVADLRLDHPQVSRRHAIIAQWASRARVLDDRSANGTFVNGRCVTVADLYDGDVLRFGVVALRYVEIAPAWKTPPLRRVPTPLRAEGEPLGPVAA